MASNTSSPSRAGPGGVSGLASSLRSAANTSGRSGSLAAGSGSASPGAAANNHNNHNNTNNNQGYYNNNNNSGINNNNNSQWGGNQYRHHDRDATVPDSDDSTEEDEEYTSYIQEQEAAAQNNNGHSGAGNRAHNMRHMLHDDDQEQDDDDHHHQHQDDQRANAAAVDRQEVQARQNQILEDDEESFEEDEDDMDDEDDDDDDASDTNSLTEDDIDFNLVYAFHTFVATQEGQASVVRNDSLMLLEDANVYWWLVRVLKTGVIGYIPAENIETPFERLARLNKYRNVGLSAPSPEWGTFDEPIQPLSGEAAAHKASHRRSVIFTGQNEYFGASENEWDDEDGEGDEDDEMGEYYEGREEGEEGSGEGEEGGGKTAIQLEAERVQAEILEEENQRLQQQQQGGQRARKNSYATDDSDQEMEGDDENEEVVTNQYRRPLLDDDDLVFSDEPRKISLTPSIAQDDVSIRVQTPIGRSKKLRLGDEDSLNGGGGSPRSVGSPGQRGNNSGEVSASPLTPRQATGTDGSSNSDSRSGSLETGEEDRATMQKRMQERTEAKLAALLGDKESNPGKGSANTGDSVESPKKPGKFKSLFGVGKGSKDKEKEKKEKERLEKERLAGLGNKSASAPSSPGGSSFASSADGQRTRTNSNGSIGSPMGAGPNSANGPMSPTNVSDDGDSQEIITLRVYPGNVDFGASMYKTVVVNCSTMASEVANQAVVKFRLAPDGVASSSDFFLTVRGVDGDETVLLPTDKPMAIYQSLTAHLTTPLPANHRLSISSVSSMMSVNSVSSFNSNPPSTPTSPNSVRRIGSGKSDPHQRSIRFLLNKKIKRGSVSSAPGTPTTPTTPTAPLQEDFFWVKVICKAEEFPQSMVVIDGMRTAMYKSDPRAQGQVFANKVEHWIPMHSASKAGDVIFKTLETIGIRSGVVEGVPSHVLASKRNSAPNGIVIEYQLSLKLNSPVSPKSKQGDELPLVPQIPLIRCFDDHQLAPVRRSPKADVASMPINPEYVFYLRKSPKSVQEENNFAQQQQSQQQTQQQPRKVPAPLQAQSLFGASSTNNDSPRSPAAQPSPTTSVTSPRSLRSLRSFEDANSTQGAHNNGPLSPSAHQTRMASPLQQGPISGSARTGSPSQGPDGNIRIPRRTESALLTPTSPTRATHAEGGAGSRTPTPDHGGMGRNRSPSVSQGMRPGQAPSPIPGIAENDSSRASTPERPARPERPDRPQRAIAQPLTHGPSPLSLTAVMLQANEQGNHLDFSHGGRGPLVAAPLNIKKNEAQGMDVYLDKGVVRSSRLMNSKQYRYSFIPAETGEEVDISDIIEDILGEEASSENEPAVVAAKGEDVLQHLAVAANSSDVESASRRDRTAAAVARAANAAASRKERAAGNTREEVISSATRSRVGSPVMMRSAMSEQQQHSREGSPSPTQSRQAAAMNRTLASPLSLASPSTTTRSQKRDSDVEIQVASVASLSARSASPMLTEQPPSARGSTDSSAPGSPRSLRSGSPYGMAKPTLISNANNVRSGGAGVGAASPLKDGGSDVQGQDPSVRSFSPIPRRLQSPSPASLKQAPSPTSGSPNLRPSSPSSTPSGGRVSPAASAAGAAAVNGRSNSGASISSVTSARNRSVSASVGGDKPVGGRLAHSNSNGSNYSERVGTPSSPGGSNKEWLLSSDYNTGMQDLLTLVRAGRSSSVSSPSNSSMHLLRGGVGAGGAGPWIGKDGKLIALPSTIKASLLNNSSSRSQSPSSPSSENGADTMLRGKNSSSSLNNTRSSGGGGGSNKNTTSNDSNDKSGSGGEKSEEQTRMMLLMLNELTLKDVQQDCHPDVYDCWKDVDADLDRVERELDDLLVTVKASIF